MKVTLEICNIEDSHTAAEWNAIYETNPDLGYFSSYEFNRLFVKYFGKSKKRKSMKPLIVKAVDDKRGTLMFLPLCKHRNEYYMLWDYSSVPYCDAVFRNDLTREDFEAVFYRLSDVLGNETVFFTKMNDRSRFTEFLRDRYTPYKKRSCADVELLKSFEYTYKLLDKDCREIIEDARGKIAERGLEFRTEFYYGKSLPQRVIGDVTSIVRGDDRGFFERIKDKKHAKYNAVTIGVKNGAQSFCAVSYADGYPAACAYGFYRNKKLTVVRLESSKYGVSYSSKHLLLSDLMRYSIENRRFSSIDLCRSDDKAKKDFASKKHYVYSFEIKL